MQRMARMSTRKRHSWWWDSHISPKNSKWLAENLEEMDRCIKEMLKLIDDEGDSFQKKAEMYYQRRPELVSHVEDFYRMYRALAERYDNVTGELRKNIRSDRRSQSSTDGSDIGSLVLERNPLQSKPGPKAAGFNVFLGSRKGIDGSSSNSESDSNSESSKDENGGDHDDDDDDDDGDDDGDSRMRCRILELENELRDARERLYQHGKGSNGQFENPALKNDLLAVNSQFEDLALKNDPLSADGSLRFVEAEASSPLERKLEEDNVTSWSKKVESTLLIPVLELENEDLLSLYDHAMTNTKDTIFGGFIKSEKVSLQKLSPEARAIEQDHMLQKLESDESKEVKIEPFNDETELLVAQNTGLMIDELNEGNSFLTDMMHLELSQYDHSTKDSKDAEAEFFSLRKSCPESKAIEQDHMLQKLESGESTESKIKLFNEGTELLEAHNTRLRINELNEGNSLLTDMKHSELRSRVKELEHEVGRQRAVILDGAEGKREAIRQLCFSLEHYRDGYRRLLQVLKHYSEEHCRMQQRLQGHQRLEAVRTVGIILGGVCAIV